MEDNTIKLDLAPETTQVEETKVEAKEEDTAVEQVKEAPVQEEAPKPEALKNDDGDHVVNFNNSPDAVQERKTEEVSLQPEAGNSEKVVEEVRVKSTEDESQPLELVDEKETPEVKVEIPELKTEQPKVVLPEGIDKLVDFMKDTGLQGQEALQAYAQLNQDLEALNPTQAVIEYYKQTKPFLTEAQINKQLQSKFGYDAEDAEADEIENKGIAFQEELYKAKKHLTGYKEKYYADLKLKQQSSLPPEAQEAVSFYSDYKKQTESTEKLNKTIIAQTDQVFNDEFKGFDFKVGENKYRFKVNDVAKQKEKHQDVSKIFNRFYDSEKGTLADPAGYNKALFAADNADRIAQHFYEQGRADAITESAKKSKNIDMSARSDNSAITTSDGSTIKVVSGDSKQSIGSKMRIKGWN